MKRTPGDTERRQRIADAASGFTRAAVVLYASCLEGEDALPGLRRFADARDWVVVGEIADPGLADVAPSDRARWPEVVALIESQQAEGIITPPGSLLLSTLRAYKAGSPSTTRSLSPPRLPTPSPPRAVRDDYASGHRRPGPPTSRA